MKSLEEGLMVGWVMGSKHSVSDFTGQKNTLGAECTPRSPPAPLLIGGHLQPDLGLHTLLQ